MKTLLVLRHAKAKRDQERWDDYERPLEPSGKADADRMARELSARELIPDYVVSSSAKRARATAKRVREIVGEPPASKSKELYLSSVDEHLGILRESPADSQRVLLVGHNPTLEDLVGRLTGTVVALSTACLACIQLDVETWLEVGKGSGQLLFVLEPDECDGTSETRDEEQSSE